MCRRDAEDAGGFCKCYAPEASAVLAPMEIVRFHACYSYVVAVIHHASFVAFMENSIVSIISKGSNIE